jgi:DNA polymerase-1
MSTHRLLLVDGSSYLYRAFHAMPDLRNSQGLPTGAIQGMVNMMRRARTEIDADHIACIFDAKGKTFREEMYPDYKANRSSMPEDLAAQIETIHQVVKAMGWPVLVVPGIEADDVIGTLAKQAKKEGWEVLISTGDKDMAQLVEPGISLINTMTEERLDTNGVVAKFGVPPERIVDYLTITGDAVDNVPGVHKAGPKTAVKWLTEFGNLDVLMERASEVKGVVGENLRSALDWLPKARELLTIKIDCDLADHLIGLDELHAKDEDKEQLRAIFTDCGFRFLLKDLDKSSSSSSDPKPPVSEPISSQKNTEVPSGDLFGFVANISHASIERHYECITQQNDLERWIDKINSASLTCVDTETTGLDALKASLVGISLSVEPGVACYIPLAHTTNEDQLDKAVVLNQLKPWLESSLCKKVGQNLKYDLHIFANEGIFLQGVLHDTLLESYVLESHRSHDMDSLASRHLGEKTISYEEVCGKGIHQITFDQVSLDVATRYAAEDADITLRLHHAMYPAIEADPKLLKIYQDIEMPAMHALAVIERNGVLIDTEKLAAQGKVVGQRLLELEKQIHELAGQPFNIQSPKQIAEILFGKLELPIVKKTPSGAPSTDEEVLQKLAENYPLPARILDYRSLAKLQSTYIEKLPRMVHPKTGRVHTSYLQAVAVTGRLASSDPNLQNIPVRTEEGRKIREAFIAPLGAQIVSADYSQIELRIMAHIAEDENLLKAFANGEDIHRATAAEMFHVELDQVTSEQRRYAKVINFGLIYGMSAFGLAGNLGIERSAAQQYIDTYFARYPGVASYMANTRILAKQQGYVETVFGRRLWLPEIRSANGMRRQGAERAAINAPMQGTAADLIKLAMIAVQSWLEQNHMQTRLLMQVHDELVLEVPDTEMVLVRENLPKLMTEVATLKVPLLVEVGVGLNWEEAH